MNIALLKYCTAAAALWETFVRSAAMHDGCLGGPSLGPAVRRAAFMRAHALLCGVTLVVGATAACTGTIGNGGDGNGGQTSGTAGGSGGPAGSGNATSPPATTGVAMGAWPADPTLNDGRPPPLSSLRADPNAAGSMPLRRLSHVEYNNTVNDLLKAATYTDYATTYGLPSDLEPQEVFLYRRAAQTTTLDLQKLRDAAEGIAAAVDPTGLATCATGADQMACAKTFITTFGMRAYRRPLLPDEITRLTSLYSTARTTVMLDYPGTIKLLVEAILQTPEFLYRWELGPQVATKDPTGVLRLSGYEMASRLSYFLWRTMPDQALFDAAAADKLSTDADVQSQVTRMLADPRARASFAEFFKEWLSVSAEEISARPKDPSVYPTWNATLQGAMASEVETFVSNVVFDSDGRLSSLLTGGYSFVNDALAPIYGLSPPGSTNLQKTTLNPTQRAGMLTQAGFLTVTGSTNGSHPVKRGRRVLERLLCGVLGRPPPVVPPPLPASAGGSTRQRFVMHDQNGCTGTCHARMDSIGFGLEHYDGLGNYRTVDNGVTVDATSSVKLDGADHSFDGAVELSKLLANSAEMRECFVRQWARYAFSRIEEPADVASLQAAVAALRTGNDSVRELAKGLALSRSFRFRALAAGEMQ